MSSAERDLMPLEINFIQDMNGAGVLKKRLRSIAVALAVACVVLLLAWLWLDAIVQTNRIHAELDKVTLRIAELQAPVRLSNQSAVQQHIELAEQLKQSAPKPVELLDSLTQLLPDNVNVRVVAMDGPASIKLTALFADAEQVAALVRSLRASGNFTVDELGHVQKIGLDAAGQAAVTDNRILPLQTTLAIGVAAGADSDLKQAEGEASP